MDDKFWCNDTEECRDRRTADAQFRGQVMSKLENIEKSISALWAEQIVNRGDIKSLYFRIGLISGGTSLVVSLIVSLVTKNI